MWHKWINITTFSHIKRQTEASSLWFRNIVAVFAPYFLSFCGFSSGPSPRLWWAAVWWELGNLQPPGCDAPPLSGSRGRSPEVSTPAKKERNSLNKSFYEYLIPPDYQFVKLQLQDLHEERWAKGSWTGRTRRGATSSGWIESEGGWWARWGERVRAERGQGSGCLPSRCRGNSEEWEASVGTPDLKMAQLTH